MYRLLKTFANSLDPDQARQMSGLIWIQTVWHSDGNPEIIFRKSWFWKKSADDKKKQAELPSRQRALIVHNCPCFPIKIIDEVDQLGSSEDRSNIFRSDQV